MTQFKMRELPTNNPLAYNVLIRCQSTFVIKNIYRKVRNTGNTDSRRQRAIRSTSLIDVLTVLTFLLECTSERCSALTYCSCFSRDWYFKPSFRILYEGSLWTTHMLFDPKIRLQNQYLALQDELFSKLYLINKYVLYDDWLRLIFREC